eukprot:INCI4297.1.p1 GENE.INCI4297.1~~INCI4297.1.p1  ORF type:complete len:950 (-),score=199.85 INCI4297.1:552-3401(-)
MGLQFSQPGAAAAILEQKAVYVLQNPHASGNVVRKRLNKAVAALLKAQDDADEAEGSAEEAEARVKDFVRAFGGPEAVHYGDALIHNFSGIFRSKNTTIKQRVISFAQKFGEKYQIKFDQAFMESINKDELEDLHKLADATETIDIESSGGGGESLVEQLSTAYACPLVEVQNALQALVLGQGAEESKADDDAHADEEDKPETASGIQAEGVELRVVRRSGYEIFLDAVFAGTSPKPTPSPKARSRHGSAASRRSASQRSHSGSPRRSPLPSPLPRKQSQVEDDQPPHRRTFHGSRSAAATYAAAFECHIVCDSIAKATGVVQQLADGKVEGLKIVACENHFVVGNEEKVLRRREIRVSCELSLEVWDAVSGGKDIVAFVDIVIRHRSLENVFAHYERNKDRQAFEVIVRGAHHFRALHDIWPQNSKLKLLRSVIRANGGSSDVATAVRACLPPMRRYISLAKSRRSARLAELNGTNHSPQAKAHTQAVLRIVEILRNHLAFCTLYDAGVTLRAAGEQAKAKHDGPRGDIIYAETQKDFADYEEVLAQIKHERLNNLALFRALSQASTHDDPVCPDLRYLLVPLVAMIGMDRTGQLVPDAEQSDPNQNNKARKQRKRRAVPTSVHNKKRRDDQPVLVNLNSLRRFLKKRRKFLVEEVGVDGVALDSLIKQARKQVSSQKHRQQEFVRKGGSTTGSVAEAAQKSALRQMQEKSPRLCAFVDEVCPGLDDTTYMNLIKRANLAMYYTRTLKGQLKAIFSYTGPLFVSDSVVDKLKRAHRDRIAKASKNNKAFDSRLAEYAKRKEELLLKISFDAAMAREADNNPDLEEIEKQRLAKMALKHKHFVQESAEVEARHRAVLQQKQIEQMERDKERLAARELRVKKKRAKDAKERRQKVQKQRQKRAEWLARKQEQDAAFKEALAKRVEDGLKKTQAGGKDVRQCLLRRRQGHI